MERISGVITAMVTPFDESGALDVESGRRLARHLVTSGSHGLVVNGTTGESATMDDAEKLELLGAVLDEVGAEATVICGTGSNDTARSVELTEKATAAGAHAVLVVTPYYNKPNPAGLRAHFAAVAGSTSLPVVLYNIPSRCVINMDPEFIAALAAEIDNVVAVKQANGDELRAIDGIDVLAGNDDIFRSCLELGGVGGILVASHVVGPQLRELYDAVAAGEGERARAIDEGLRSLYEALSVTTNPIPVKTALEMLGVIDAWMRLPMVAADDAQREVIRLELERQGLLAASPT